MDNENKNLGVVGSTPSGVDGGEVEETGLAHLSVDVSGFEKTGKGAVSPSGETVGVPVGENLEVEKTRLPHPSANAPEFAKTTMEEISESEIVEQVVEPIVEVVEEAPVVENDELSDSGEFVEKREFEGVVSPSGETTEGSVLSSVARENERVVEKNENEISPQGLTSPVVSPSFTSLGGTTFS